MKTLVLTMRRLLHWTLHLGTALLILTALALALSRLLPLPLAAWLDLEKRLADTLQASVRIAAVDLTWWGWGPALRLRDVRLLDPATQAPIANFSQAFIKFDLPRSLYQTQPVLDHVRLQGGRLTLIRTADGRLTLFERAASGPSLSLQTLITRLSAIRSLDVTVAKVQLHDASSAQDWTFENLQLSLRGGQEQQLHAALTLPEAWGERLSGTVTLDTDAADPDRWTAEFYLRGDNLALGGESDSPLAGRAQAEIWGDWRDGQLATITSRTRIREPALVGTASADTAEWHIRLDGQREGQDWHLTSHWRGVDAAGADIFETNLAAALTLETNGYRVQAQAQNLRVQELAILAALELDPPLRERLEQLAPSGHIPELVLRAASQSGRFAVPKNYALTARLHRLETQPEQRLPGAAGLSGRLFFDQTGGWFELDTRALQIDSNLLRAPVALETAQGTLRWLKQTAGWQLETTGVQLSNADLTAKLAGLVEIFADGGSPRLNVRLDFHETQVGQIPRYLPAAVMSTKLVDWLDRALVAGQATDGRVIFKGRLADFPFDDGEGLFEARLQVQNAVLDYFPEWPPVKDLSADIVFHNRSFQLNAQAGRIYDATAEQVQARIDDLDGSDLTVVSRSRGQAATLLRLLRETPLADAVGHYVQDMEVTGTNTLELKLEIPLRGQGRQTQVSGAVGFDGGRVQLPEWGLDLQDVRGKLAFTRSTLTAKKLRLRFRGEPATLAIARAADRQAMRFRLRTRMTLSDLLGSPLFESYAEGRASWDIGLTIRDSGDSGGGGESLQAQLKITSDLQGMALHLPPPLDKAAADARAVEARVDLAGTKQIAIDYAPDVRALLELTGFPKNPQFRRGELRINAGSAKLPDPAGLTIVADLPYFDLATLVGAGAGDGTLPDWLQRVEANFAELAFGGQTFADVSAQVQRRQTALNIELNSARLAGRVVIPAASGPVQIELDRLALRLSELSPAQSGKNTGAPDPRKLPPLSITLDDLRLDEHSLGRLRLSTAPQADGLRIVDASLRSDLHELTATGTWRVTPTGQETDLQAKLHSQDLGQTLAVFGYAAELQGGETQAELTVGWPGALPQFSLATLQGRLTLTVGEGRLTSVEPGVGRVFGLLSLNNLMRRLRLDFSDFTGAGLAFDSIDGVIELRDGHAYPQDLSIQSPSARIRIGGRIDLVEREYDQTVTVTPRLGESLGIAGTLAGGPVVGAALFLADKIVGNGAGKMTRHEYRIMGSWDDPVVKRANWLSDGTQR